MKKVAILTISDNFNFGNRLQNYALKKEIEKFGCEVNSVWIEKPLNASNIRRLLSIIKNKIKRLKGKKRRDKFKRFTKRYLNNDYSIILDNNLNRINNKYDYYVIGSDQVWNYHFIPKLSIYFGEGLDKEKCFSYAASFGISNIPEDYVEKYKIGLNHLKYISTREERGKELVKEISDREDAEVLLDPTMLLTSDEWIQIERKPKADIQTKYILLYFLGEMDEKRKEEINRVAKENNYEIINILDKNNKCYYNIGPSEFIYLIHNASLICTDSFHACVFSVLFDKPFIIFDRIYEGDNMNSRIDTLLNKLNIKNRKFENEITAENLNHDYVEAHRILNEERIKSNQFLKKALQLD